MEESEGEVQPARGPMYKERFGVGESEARRRLVDQNVVVGLEQALAERLDGQVAVACPLSSVRRL